MKEEWRAVPGYEGLYEVSNCGRVRSLDRVVRRINDSFFILPGRIMRFATGMKGYSEVVLVKDGKNRTMRVHRLVAIAFIPNPDNLPMVNHKDECKTNNHIDNLEWCTNKYNLNYGSGKYRIESKRRPVEQYDLIGNLIGEYTSIREASAKTSINASMISSCCKRKYGYRTAGGFKWNYKT